MVIEPLYQLNKFAKQPQGLQPTRDSQQELLVEVHLMVDGSTIFIKNWTSNLKNRNKIFDKKSCFYHSLDASQ